MAVRIRLTRTGARNNGSFRVIAADSRSPRDGRFLEVLGWYAPRQADPNFGLKLDRIEDWVAHGAQMSDTVRSLIKKAGKAPAVEPPKEAPEPAAEKPVESPVEPVAEETVAPPVEEEPAAEEPVVATEPEAEPVAAE